MKTETGQSYRIRYGHHCSKSHAPRQQLKNCLVTIQPENSEFVFFGIARCKLSADNFRKKEGRELALSRAEQAVKENVNVGFYLSLDGTKGSCKVQYVRSLLRHFEHLDRE